VKSIFVALLFGINGFGQNAPVMSDQSTRSPPTSTPKRGDRVFFFKDGSGSVNGEAMLPFHWEPYELRRGNRLFFFKEGTDSIAGESIMPFQLNRMTLKRGDRVFFFKDGTGNVARQPVMPFHFTPYELKRGDRVFFFKDGSGSVLEKKGHTSGQGAADKK
jgi:hypothetical protein